jgi:peptidoglycan-associated lipoprotein
MRKQTLPILLVSGALAAASLAGCGDKAKKKTVATNPVVADAPGGSNDEATPTTDTDSGDTAASLEEVVYFAHDSSDLDDSARNGLQENADWMGEDTGRVLTIEGHTDETGTTDYNLALGERRARVTRDYLVRLGVDGKRIQIITYGEEKPASAEDSMNRRSVFVSTRK